MCLCRRTSLSCLGSTSPSPLGVLQDVTIELGASASPIGGVSMPSSSRYFWLRVHHGPGHRSNRHGPHALSLWRAALSASEETLQTGFMSVAWQNLFRNQLSQTDRVWLRWKDDLGSSAEIRRAYSALYGRFFARAVLSSNLTLSSFIPLRPCRLEAVILANLTNEPRMPVIGRTICMRPWAHLVCVRKRIGQRTRFPLHLEKPKNREIR